MVEEIPEEQDIRKAIIIGEGKERTDGEKEKMEKAEEELQKKLQQESRNPKIILPEQTSQEREIRTTRILPPEQQPTPEPEKGPADVGLDIDAAKKYLEKVYGGDKSSVIVGAENAEKFSKTEIVDKSIKEKPTAEESAEKVRVAKNELIDLVKSINEAREKKETKTEISLYDKAKEVFETATDKNLEKTAREKAKVEAENEGLKVVAPEEYRKAKTAETQERVRQKERSAVIKERWDTLSDKEKGKYFDKAEDKNNPAAIDSARIKFATELKGKIDAKKQELSKGKKGIAISEDVFYDLMRKGLKSEDIKRRGFFGRMFFGGEITISPLDKTDGRGSLICNKEYLAKEIENRVKKNISDAAQEEVERKIIDGQKRWRERKQRHSREIIQETALKFKSEKTEEKLKVKSEEERPSETTESLKSFEKISDIEKVIKKIDSDIKTKREQQKKIQVLKKKIKDGKPLNLKEKAFLNKVDSAYRKEAA